MKRVGNLWPTLVSDENLKVAIFEVNRTHRKYRIVDWVERTVDDRVVELRNILEEGFSPAPSRHLVIYDKSANKTRNIHSPRLWPDQYIHHALIQVLEPIMMRGMDHWCCGSIKGRGISYGVRGIKKWMKNDKKGTKYCAEIDIHHFYESLSPNVVQERMGHLIKDKKILDLIKRTTRDGILIGSYCSQWFANTVLQPLDHIIRQELGVSHYVRYMDNFLLFSNRKRTLHKAIKRIQQWLSQHGLRLKSNWQVFPTSKRLPSALGYRYGRGYVLPKKKNLLRFRRACRRAYKRLVSGKQIHYRMAAGILSRIGSLKHCKCFSAIAAHLSQVPMWLLKNIVRQNSIKKKVII